MQKMPVRVAGVLFGQLISFIIIGTNIINETLSRLLLANEPGLETVLTYSLVLAVYLPQYFVSLSRKTWAVPPPKLLCLYLLSGVLDFGANYLVILSFKHVSILNILLISCLSTPTTMALSRLTFKTRYSCNHIFGVVASCSGVAILLLSNLRQQEQSDTSNIYLGNLLCLISAISYGACNIIQEYLIRLRDSNQEYLSLAASSSFVCSLIVFFTVDWQSSQVNSLSWKCWALLAGFALCMILFYSLVPFFLKKNSSTLLNLSLVSGNIATLILSLLIFELKVDWVYMASFSLVLIGLLIFNLKEPRAVVNEDIKD